MTDLFLLSRVQMRRIERYFPLSHGIARVDDRRIVSAIVFVIKNDYTGWPKRMASPTAATWRRRSESSTRMCFATPEH